MDDLISRAAAIEAILGSFSAIRAIEELPAVDAVPVVRCKVCKHWVCADTVGSIRYGDCTNGHSIISRHAMPNENYYCADGERREGE